MIVRILLLGVFLSGSVVLVLLLRSKQASSKGQGVLQQVLPLQRFHPKGPMVVAGRFRQMIRVGDQNLYAMTLDEITLLRDRFRDMVKRLDHPFQLSVQARRANYTDFVRYSEEVVTATAQAYTDPAFTAYTGALLHYLREEAEKPRTDRENLIVVGVVPHGTGEPESEQLDRLWREQAFVTQGLDTMGLSHTVLSPVQSVEAIQNFYHRERAMSQRYRDALHRQTHAPYVDGKAVTARDLDRQTEVAP